MENFMEDTYFFEVCGIKFSIDTEDAHYLDGSSWTPSLGYLRQSSGDEHLFHRIIMKAKKGQFIDHIDGDKTNNRKSNLRFCTHSQNMKNRKIHSNNKSGFKGVYLVKKTGRWRVQITCDGRRHYFGTYIRPEDAYSVYLENAEIIHGDFHRK